MSRIQWSQAALGAQVVPILLIHGLPAIIYPDGVNVTSFSIATPDTAWWPANTYSNWTSYAKPWLRLDDGITFSERAIPTATTMLDVSEITLTLSDVGQAATQFFDNELNASASFITSSVDQFDTTINVMDTSAFPASGFIYLGMEAILYTGTTPTSFTGCVRAQFGSVAASYPFTPSQGSGLGNPQVTSIPVEYVGRPATLWLCEIENGAMVRVQLEHFGTIGTGPALTGGGDSLDDGWVLPIDHAVKRMNQKIITNPVSVGGFAHPGNFGARGFWNYTSPPSVSVPFSLRLDETALVPASVILLTGDDAAPDNGGWHPTKEAFLDALVVAGNSLGSGMFGAFAANLVDGELRVDWISQPPFPTSRTYLISAPCTEGSVFQSTIANTRFTYNMGKMSEAWVPITNASRVYLNDNDFSTIPPAYSDPDVSVILIFGDDKDLSTRRVAQVTSQGTTLSGANYVTCNALTTFSNTRGAATGSTGTSAPAGTTLWEGGLFADGFVISEPTTARVGLYVRGNTWVEALQRVAVSLGSEYKFLYDAIDWTRMAEVVAAYPSPFPQRREYIIDLNTTLMSILQNEAALNGFALTVYRGRVCITRVAEFSPTETTDGTITNDDLDSNSPSPTYERGADGIVNTYSVFSPDDGVTVNITDRTSVARYGGQGTISAVMPRTLLGGPRDGGRLYTQVFAQAVQVLGPLRYPYRHVTVRVPLNLYDLQIGELVTLTLWRVPNGSGGRGITNAISQIVAREVVLYQESEGHVTYTMRLNPSNVTGYAPCGLIESGGIVGPLVTFDVSTVPGGFSGTGVDGLTFAVGDLVRLVELDTNSPIASTSHTVSAVATNSLQLSPSPSASFAALAASGPLKVMVIYDDWTTIVAGNRTEQEKYCFMANTDGTLDATTDARIYAA